MSHIDALGFLFLAMVVGCFVAAVSAVVAMWVFDAIQKMLIKRRQWAWLKRQSRAPFGGPYRTPCADDFTREESGEIRREDWR